MKCLFCEKDLVHFNEFIFTCKCKDHIVYRFFIDNELDAIYSNTFFYSLILKELTVFNMNVSKVIKNVELSKLVKSIELYSVFG